MLEALARRIRVEQPGVASPRVAWVVQRVFGPILRTMWPARLEGWERLPSDRPCLVVANHSGTGIVDVLDLALLALERPGGPPRLAGLAHPLGFFVPILGRVVPGLGGIPSTYAHAKDALARGASLLVFPGGDHEAFRPVWQAGRVDFAGRQGFLRIAREARVPIVPLGIWGTCFSQPVLWRSRLLPWLALFPRALGVKRYGITVNWLVGVIAIGLALLPAQPLAAWAAFAAWTTCMPHVLPWFPWPVRMRLGAPLEPEDLFGPDGQAPLEGAYARVLAVVQAEVDAARRG